MRAALYTRVSTAKRSNDVAPGEKPTFEQNPEVQEEQLRQLAAQRGWDIARVYTHRASVLS